MFASLHVCNHDGDKYLKKRAVAQRSFSITVDSAGDLDAGECRGGARGEEKREQR